MISTRITHSQTLAPAWRIWLIRKMPWVNYALSPELKGAVAVVEEKIEVPVEITGDLKQLTYKDTINENGAMDSFEITLSNRHLQYLDTPWFQEGNCIEMQWGYVGNMCRKRIGVINGIEVVLSNRDDPLVIIRGNCIGSRMAGKCMVGVWKKVEGEELGFTPSEIAAILAEHYGLQTDIQETTGPRREWVQAGVSDWDFLKQLAAETLYSKEPDDIGFRFWVQNETLHFRAIKADKSEEVLMKLAWYTDDTGMFKEFRIKHDTKLSQGAGVETTAAGLDPRRMMVRGFVAMNRTDLDRVSLGPRTTLQPGYNGTTLNQFFEDLVDPVTQARLLPDTHTVADPDSTDPLAKRIVTGRGTVTPVTGAPGHEQSAHPARDVAVKQFEDGAEDQLEVEAIVVGWPTLEARKLVDIQCVGSKYSGLYRIKEVQHDIGPNGYECRLLLVRNAKGEDDGMMDAKAEGKKVDSAGVEIPIELEQLVDVPLDQFR